MEKEFDTSENTYIEYENSDDGWGDEEEEIEEAT